MQRRSLVVGTAGHIDHGKTMLIRALTGVDTDRLPDEKRRGITIDLGFASMEMEATDGTPLHISFVDVPGHAHFIRNMLAGAGCVDAVMLVVSAEEGVKPQTEEHLDICMLLGVQRGFTVLSKADAVDSKRLEVVRDSVRSFLAQTFLGTSPIIPASAHTNAGLEEIRNELMLLEAGRVERNHDHLVRMPVDRAFVMKGFGTVVTGTLLSGEVQTDQMLSIEPSHRVVRVRGLQVSSTSQTRVFQGSRVAANLTGVDVSKVSRGLTLVSPDTLTAVELVDAEVRLLPNVKALKHRSRLHLHAFTANTLATVLLYEGTAVEPGASGIARLRLNQSIVLLPGDRFVLRQCSPAATIGGGRVLDAHPLPHVHKSQSLQWLRVFHHAGPSEQLCLRVDRRGAEGITFSALATESGLTVDALCSLLRTDLDTQQLFPIPPDRLLSRPSLDTATEEILGLLATARHVTNTSGIKRAELKNHIQCSPEVLNFILDKAAREQRLRMRGDSIYLVDFDPSQSSAGQQQAAAIAAIYKNAGLSAPLTSEIAAATSMSDSEVRKQITMLLREKTLVRMGSDHLFLHVDAVEGLKEQLRAIRGRHLDVAAFKQLTGLSRKYAIPLLEYLDREHITRRQDGTRIVL
jgi:selenocysteine-specific elongation factor